MKVKEKIKELLKPYLVPNGTDSKVVIANIDQLTEDLYNELYMEDFYGEEEFE